MKTEDKIAPSNEIDLEAAKMIIAVPLAIAFDIAVFALVAMVLLSLFR